MDSDLKVKTVSSLFTCAFCFRYLEYFWVFYHSQIWVFSDFSQLWLPFSSHFPFSTCFLLTCIHLHSDLICSSSPTLLVTLALLLLRRETDILIRILTPTSLTFQSWYYALFLASSCLWCKIQELLPFCILLAVSTILCKNRALATCAFVSSLSEFVHTNQNHNKCIQFEQHIICLYANTSGEFFSLFRLNKCIW